MLLRARYLVDVDCWSEVRGQPIRPGTIRRVVIDRLAALDRTQPTESAAFARADEPRARMTQSKGDHT
jgi:hypothetical protein